MDEDEEKNEERDAPFVIDSMGKAEWAMEKIKEERQRLNLYITAAEERIEELQRQMDEQERKTARRTENLLNALSVYFETLPVKKSKTQQSFELPAGKMVKKYARLDFTHDDKALVKWAEENAPEYLKRDVKIEWGELKKHLSAAGSVAVLKDTGEAVEGVSVIEKPETFDVV